MESPTLELTLYTKPPENPKDIANFLNETSSNINNPSENLSELEELFINNKHEQKLQKTGALNRDVPQLSMPLVKNIEIQSILKEDDATLMGQKLKCKSQSRRPVMDFLTLKRSSYEEQKAFLERDFGPGGNLVGSSTHRLWSPGYDNNQKNITTENATPNKFLPCKVGAGGGAFKPYKRSSSSVAMAAATTSNEATSKGKELEAAAAPRITGQWYGGGGGVNMRSIGLDMATAMWQNRERSYQLRAMEQQPAGLKNLYRRNWSPELHDRFTQAVEFLGGPNVATPKQIMEIMKIDSLTINQVKSHLQKYRLNKKRFPELADDDE